MSIKKRNINSVATLASALCILTSTSCGGGEITPKLIKTTKPIRIEPHGESANPTPVATLPRRSRPDVRNASPLKRVGDEPTQLREFLSPDANDAAGAAVRQTSGGVPRKNHFFDLHNDGQAATVSPPMRSAALAPPKRFRPGQVQKNPLVVDAPPQLRRFDVDERPLILPQSQPNSTVNDTLVLKEKPLPPRVVEDLDHAVDMLSVDTDNRTAVKDTVRSGGFGMLAIDHIGSHMPSPTESGLASEQRPMQRYATDLVSPAAPQLSTPEPGSEAKAPAPLDTLRNHLDTFDGLGLIEESDVEHKERAVADPKTAQSIASALDLFPAQSATNAEASSAPDSIEQGQSIDQGQGAIGSGIGTKEAFAETPIRRPFDDEERVAVNKPEVKPASPDRADSPAKPKKKTGWMQRLASWPTKKTSSKSKADSVPDAGEADAQASRTSTLPRKRPGGILDQWLRR